MGLIDVVLPVGIPLIWVVLLPLQARGGDAIRRVVQVSAEMALNGLIALLLNQGSR